MLGKLASLLLFAGIARELGQSGLGIFVFALAWTEISLMVVGVGLDRYFLRRVARDRSRREELANVLALKLALALPVVALSFTLVALLDFGGATSAAIYVLTPGLLMDSLRQAVFSVFNAFERGGMLALSLVMQRFAAAALGLGALALGFGVVTVAAAYTAGAALGLAVTLTLYLRRIGPLRAPVSLAVWRRLTAESLPFGAQDVFGVLLARLDAVLLSLLATQAAVGRYGAAYRLLEATFFITYSIGGAFSAMYTYLDHDSRPSVGAVFQRSVKLSIALMAPLALTFAVLAEPLMRTLFGDAFEDAAGALRLLAPAVVLMSVVVLSSSLVVSRPRPDAAGRRDRGARRPQRRAQPDPGATARRHRCGGRHARDGSGGDRRGPGHGGANRSGDRLGRHPVRAARGEPGDGAAAGAAGGPGPRSRHARRPPRLLCVVHPARAHREPGRPRLRARAREAPGALQVRGMKILAIASYGDLGGSQLALATFLEHRPADVDAEALLLTDGPLGARIAGSLPVHVARGYEGRPGPASLVRFTREFLPLLARLRPDAVWAVGQKAALLAAPACRARGVPIVWHKVDFSWDRLLAKPVAVAVDGVVAPSRAVVDALGPLRRSRFLGVADIPSRLGEVDSSPDPTHPTIGTLARLVPYKGHHHILRAAAALSTEFPSLRVILAGAPAPEYPDYPSRLEAVAAELGLSDRLELPGFVEAVEGVLSRLTVFVNATYRDAEGFGLEGLSGAMLEASWAGLPIVATRGGGTAEGVTDGVTGTLVDDAEPGALAAAIAPYLREPALAARTGQEGRAFARERFAPEAAARRLFGLIALVTKRGRSPHELAG